jgi:hypothetical protein
VVVLSSLDDIFSNSSFQEPIVTMCNKKCYYRVIFFF